MSSFAPDLSASSQKLLEKAVAFHSLYRLPAGLTDEELTACRILRDADKIDIFRVNCDTPLEEIYNVSTEELKSAAVSDAVKECFFNRTAVRRDLRVSAIDFVVGHICLVFELVYPVSRQIAKEQGYVEKLLAFQSANNETEAWFAYMREHIWDEIT